MVCNPKKSVCMIFELRDRTKKFMVVSLQKFTLGGSLLYVVIKVFKRHIKTDTLSDDNDMQREIRNLFTRTNILSRRFAKCSTDVKITLFNLTVFVYMMLACG